MKIDPSSAYWTGSPDIWKPTVGEQTVVGRDGLLAGVHQVERAGAVGVFRVALIEAGLSEQRGLLVA